MNSNLFLMKWIMGMEACSVYTDCSEKKNKCSVLAGDEPVPMWSVVGGLEGNWMFVFVVEQTMTFRIAMSR
jgi:hypothetical protein